MPEMFALQAFVIVAVNVRLPLLPTFAASRRWAATALGRTSAFGPKPTFGHITAKVRFRLLATVRAGPRALDAVLPEARARSSGSTTASSAVWCRAALTLRGTYGNKLVMCLIAGTTR